MRPKKLPVILALAMSYFVVVPAGADVARAASITNRDAREHSVTVIEGDAKFDRVLKPNEAVDGICLKGCLIRINGSENDEYELEGLETVSIEDGFLYYDGPDAPAADPGAPSSNPPVAPPK